MADCLVNPLKCVKDEGNSIRITDPTPPVAMVPISHAPGLESQSRKSIEEDIKCFKEILGLGLSEIRPMDSKKKLIIFDDVWKSFKPEDIGVPYGGCKIMLTSRLKDDVCEEMGADKVIEIQLDFSALAKAILTKCGGLPLAIVIAELISRLRQSVNLFLDIGRLNMSARYYKPSCMSKKRTWNKLLFTMRKPLISSKVKRCPQLQISAGKKLRNFLRDWNNIKRLLRFMIYEDIGRQSLNNNLLKYGVKGHLLASSARVMCCNQQCIRAIPGFGSNIFWNTRVQIAGRFSGCA